MFQTDEKLERSLERELMSPDGAQRPIEKADQVTGQSQREIRGKEQPEVVHFLSYALFLKAGCDPQ